MLNLKSKIKRKEENLLASPLADEIVMMNVKTGDYLSLNSVATSIWNLLEHPVSGEEICQKLILEYNIDEETCLTETTKFLTRLQEEDLIRIDE